MKFNEWYELMKLYETGRDEEKMVVVEILHQMFPDIKGYHAFGADQYFDDIAQCWITALLIVFVSEGSVDIPEKYMVKIVNYDNEGNKFEDTMLQVPGLMRRRIPINFYTIREND